MIDLLKAQVDRATLFYNEASSAIPASAKYDVVLAHETFCSGYAALRFAEEKCSNSLTILDIVEYPIFSERSSQNVRKLGQKSSLANELTFDFAVNVASKFDFCIATSQGQIDTYRSVNEALDIQLVRNARIRRPWRISSSTGSASLRGIFGLDEKDILLVYPNRVYMNLGIENCLYTLSKLPERFKLVVLGEIAPEMNDRVKSICRKLSLGNRFFVTGMRDPEDVLPLLSDGDVSLIPIEPTLGNSVNSLPNRVFDSIECGLPIVCFSNTEVSELVNSLGIGVSVNYRKDVTFEEDILDLTSEVLKYKANLSIARESISWDYESMVLKRAIYSHSPGAEKVLVMAGKDISRNDRIRRLCLSMLQLGLEVDVVAKTIPFPSMSLEKVTYYDTSR